MNFCGASKTAYADLPSESSLNDSSQTDLDECENWQKNTRQRR